MFFYRISNFIVFNKRKFVELYFNEQSRMWSKTTRNEPVFFPFSIKASKCSGSCKNINNPYAKLCIADVVKNLNVKLFNLMLRTTVTRHKEWHETRKFECRLDANVSNKGRTKINAGLNAKN